MKMKPLILTSLISACVLSVRADEQPVGTATFSRTTLTGIGPDKKISRRDPSDVIKVGDLYYVWYSRGPVKTGYNATVWYATSPNGVNWTEKGEAVGKSSEEGAWDEASVFTPNILVAEGRYWLFYTGISKHMKVRPDSKIGMAVSDSPDGPWEKLGTNPVLKNSDNPEDFDSHLVDDSCLIVRDGKYWLYYKGRQLGKSSRETQMGLAIADKPGGPYIRHEANPVIPGNHEVVVWPQGSGVCAMIGKVGPKNLVRTIQYAEDGINFSKTHDLSEEAFAGGTYRPEAFTDSNKGEAPGWGVEIGKAGKLLCIQRFDIEWSE
ncbi:family 43 glycosylhydrolase [Pontiellaceae bacterium B12227]|nr:family 43 glycosylhydrolase [Pontiellaceae bacterium B12227]